MGVKWVHRETIEKQKRDAARRKLEKERRATAERLAKLRRDIELARLALERQRLEAELKQSRYFTPTPWTRYRALRYRALRAVPTIPTIPTITRIVRPAPRRSNSAESKECDQEEERAPIIVPAPSCNGRGGSILPAVARWPSPITGRLINRR